MNDGLRTMSATAELNRTIRCLLILAIPTAVLSCACVCVGLLAIWTSSPKYKAPYCIGGAMIMGVACLTSCSGIILFYRMYVKNGREHVSVPTYETWSKVMFFSWGFVMLGFMAGVLVSGVGGMLAAKGAMESTEPPPTDTSLSESEYGRKNKSYAIATLTLTLVLSILMFVIYWYQKSYAWTYKSYRPDSYVSSGTSFILTRRGQTDRSATTIADRTDTRQDQIRYGLNSNNPVSSAATPTEPSAPMMSNSSRRASSFTSLFTRDLLRNDIITSRGERGNMNISTINTRTGNTTNSSDSAVGAYVPSSWHAPPPRYSIACETPPPSYRDIVRNGAFKTEHV